MLYIDSKYITIVGAQLRNFKKKKNNLYNCSCPLCGDSAKKKTKARGYFYEYNNSAFYKCHNCHASMSFDFFLKTYSVALHDSYALEKFSDNQSAPNLPKSILDVKPKSFAADQSTLNLDSISNKIIDLPDSHVAKRYLASRDIPNKFQTGLYYTDDFAEVVLRIFPNTTSKLYKNDARLIIPFYDASKRLIGLQGRTLDANNTLRYITIKNEGADSLIYGLDRFNSASSGYVVEGPIDSMFIPNCLATANSNLESACSRVSAELTLIYDNEPKNKEIVKLLEASIRHGRKVCIWPKSISKKDINDIILSGVSQIELLNIIQCRTFSGLSALLEFNQWKKI